MDTSDALSQKSLAGASTSDYTRSIGAGIIRAGSSVQVIIGAESSCFFSYIQSLHATSATYSDIELPVDALLEHCARLGFDLIEVRVTKSHSPSIRDIAGVSAALLPAPFSPAEGTSVWYSLPWSDLEPAAVNSTAVVEELHRLHAEARANLRALLAQACEEEFEDGIETAFSRGLREYIRRYQEIGIQELQRYSLAPAANVAVVAEALRHAGLLRDEATRDARLQLLLECLKHPAPAVRDAAGLGLSFLNDKRALEPLRAAAQREVCPELKADLWQIVEELEQ